MNDVKMKDDTGGPRVVRRVRWPRAGTLVAVAAGVALVTAACGGGGSGPRVASLGNGGTAGGGSPAGTAGTATQQPTGNATQLLDEWASCMRGHGDPGQADPTIDANKVIHVIIPAGAPKGVMAGPGAQACGSYLNAASRSLGPGLSQRTDSQAALLKFSKCMRANGIPDYPDPVGGNLSFNLGSGSGSGDLRPGNPVFQNASRLCASKTGVHVPGSGTPPAGTIEVQTSAGAGGSGPNG